MVLIALGVVLLSAVILLSKQPSKFWLQFLRRPWPTQEHGKDSTSAGTGWRTKRASLERRPSTDQVKSNANSGRVYTEKSEETSRSHTSAAVPVIMTAEDLDGAGSPDQNDEQATPKASAVASIGSVDIPTLTLAPEETTGTSSMLSATMAKDRSITADSRSSAGSIEKPITQPSFPSVRPPSSSLAPTSTMSSSSSLMPPPSVRPSSLKPLPRSNGLQPPPSRGLAPPPSAASALRGPAANRSAGVAPNSLIQSARTPGGAKGISEASTSTLHPSARPSRKVILAPGHSPLDWASLCRKPPTATFLRGNDVPPGRLVRVSPAQLRQRDGRRGRDAWGTYQGKVYNLTPYRDFHPGGPGELYRGAGRPGQTERLFNEVHPWVNWDAMLSECLIGILVGEGEGYGESGGQDTGSKGQLDLDAMD